MKQFFSQLWSGGMNKALVVLFGAVMTTLTTYYPADHWTPVAIAFITAVVGYLVPNAKQ